MSLQAAIHVIDLSVVWQTDPSHATLDWLLELITERIDANPEAEYLIDFIPNLKYMLRAKFLQENISEALEKFEEKVGVIYRLLLFFCCWLVFTMWRYATAVYAVVMCPFVCLSVCYTPVLYKNG